VSTRAQEVADALLGTSDDLSAHATEAERNDTAFCAALDAEVMQCTCCGWWVEASMVNDDAECEECEEAEG
jgi:hypothetical protein